MRFLCKQLWLFCEWAHIRCPFAPWVFGKMIGAKRMYKKPTVAIRKEPEA